MRKVIVAVVIILLISLAIMLQGCFLPYPSPGDPDRSWRDDRSGQGWYGDKYEPRD